MVDRLVDDADYRLPAPVRAALSIDVGDASTAIGAAVGDAITTGTGIFSAAPFIVADGITNDSPGLQAAADAAKALGALLYVPPGNVRLSAPVSLYGTVRSEARFLVDAASTGRIVVARTSTPVAVTPGGVGGLTKGSTQLTGVTGSGTLVIVSTEELIKRWNGGAPDTPYSKQETVRVGVDGSIFPPLDNTYNVALITSMTLYPPEGRATVSGVHMEVDGPTAGANDNLFTVARSDVEIIGLRVVNTTSHAMTSAVRVQDTVGVRFTEPTIEKFDLNGAGYGIAKYRSSDITITNANIRQCRHAVTGRYENRVRLVGGFYGGGVDTHWGSSLIAEDITSMVPAGGTHFAVAGGSVSVIGGEFLNGRNLVGIRADTPELSGLVNVDSARWTCDASTVSAPTPWVVGYSTLNDGAHGYNFGHIVAAPSVRITDVTLTLPTPRVGHALHVGAQSYQRGHFPAVEVDRFVVVNPGARVAAATLVKSSTTLPDTGAATKLTVRNTAFPAANDAGISISNDGDTVGGALFSVLVEDCTNVAIKVPEPSTSKLTVRRSSLIQLMRVAASVNPFVGDWQLVDCDITAPTFNGYWVADILRCRWSGAVTNSQATVNNRCKSYVGNLVAVGASGVPSVTDPYRNSTYYV